MKKVFKSVICLVLVFMVALGMVGCGGKKEAGAPTEKEQPQGKTYVINIGATSSPEHSFYRACDKFIEMVEKESNGRIKVNRKFGGVLGGEREMTEAIQLGNLEMGFISDVGLSAVVPEIGYILLPYLFPNYEAVDKYYFNNGFIGEDIKQKLQAKGVRVLGWIENDYRALTNSKRPIKTLEDLKGLKIRVPELPLFISFFTKLGTSPTPMSVTELPTALQQKTVDGQDNGVILTHAYGYEQLQKYMTLTNHMYSGGGIVISEKFWNTLPDDLKEIVRKASEETGKLQIQLNRDDVKKFIEQMKNVGVQFDELTPEAQKQLMEIGRSVWDEFADKWGKEWIERLKNEVK
ncbi:hypothetical protein DXT63_12180 [Thermoanaerobacteraceae bacterium SP2]|nr:hypothetical protein DXT63_12180 [Thermoanaerobacteraceae bacterium SP2]